MDRYLAEYPRKSPKGVNPIFAMGYGHELTLDQVADYHGDYDDFAERVRNFFQRLHEQLTYLAVPLVQVNEYGKRVGRELPCHNGSGRRVHTSRGAGRRS